METNGCNCNLVSHGGAKPCRFSIFINISILLRCLGGRGLTKWRDGSSLLVMKFM